MDMTAKLKTAIGSPAREGQRRKAKLVLKTTAADRAKVTTYQFGSAKLTVGGSAQNDWAHNIDLGQAALNNLKSVLVKPCVKLRGPKSAPLFHADPSNPRQLIRVLNGKRETGAHAMRNSS